MDSTTRSLNYELPKGLHLDKYAQQILENSKSVIVAASTPTISTLDTTAATSYASSDFLQKLGASLLNSIQVQNYQRIGSGAGVVNQTPYDKNKMEMEFSAPHSIVIDSSNFENMDELQKQLEYDKFMNEIWIGVVLTLILISMVFCICSCCLYHQFRTWKRNYHNTVAQAQTHDVEAMKLQFEIDDPVPEYTLVSGLPTYEAALELLHKSSKTCLIMYPPSIFSIFNTNEKMLHDTNASAETTTALISQLSQSQQHMEEATMPLLSNIAASSPSSSSSSSITMANASVPSIPTYDEAINASSSLAIESTTTTNITGDSSVATNMNFQIISEKH